MLLLPIHRLAGGPFPYFGKLAEMTTSCIKDKGGYHLTENSNHTNACSWPQRYLCNLVFCPSVSKIK